MFLVIPERIWTSYGVTGLRWVHGVALSMKLSYWMWKNTLVVEIGYTRLAMIAIISISLAAYGNCYHYDDGYWALNASLSFSLLDYYIELDFIVWLRPKYGYIYPYLPTKYIIIANWLSEDVISISIYKSVKRFSHGFTHRKIKSIGLIKLKLYIKLASFVYIFLQYPCTWSLNNDIYDVYVNQLQLWFALNFSFSLFYVHGNYKSQ